MITQKSVSNPACYTTPVLVLGSDLFNMFTWGAIAPAPSYAAKAISLTLVEILWTKDRYGILPQASKRYWSGG